MALPKNILVIGSSSIGESGSGMLAQALRGQLGESRLSFFGKSGAGFKDFAGTAGARAALEARVRAAAPDLVLVVMGGNPTGTAAELEGQMRWFQSWLSTLGNGVPLFWVGPPVYAAAFNQGITNLYDRVGSHVLGHDYVSSQPWTHPKQGRTPDFVHFTDFGAYQWGQKIADWVREKANPVPVVALGGGLLVVAAAVAAFFYFRRRAAAR